MISTLTQPQATCITFTHLVTLSNPRTGEEACMTVTTETDRFCDVLMAVRIQRALHGLAGFQIVEALPMEAPF